MTQASPATPLNAELVGADVVVIGPDGFKSAMFVDAARTS